MNEIDRQIHKNLEEYKKRKRQIDRQGERDRKEDCQ